MNKIPPLSIFGISPRGIFQNEHSLGLVDNAFGMDIFLSEIVTRYPISLLVS